MKPWERNWETQETQETQSKPWERDWTTEQINPKDYNGSFLQSTDGSDAKPFDKLDYFLNFYHINTPGIKEFAQKLSWIPKSFEGDIKYKEIGKGFARGSLELVKGTGGLIKIAGDWYKDSGITTPLNLMTVKSTNAIADSLTKTGQFIEDIADMGLVSDMLEQDSEIFKGSFTENPSLTRTLSTVASAIPSLGYGKIVSKFTNPVVGVTMMAGVDTQDIYWEAKEKGLNKLEAGALFTIATAGTYKLEKIGFDSIFDKKVTPFATKIIGSMLSEGLTEAGQTLWQNSVKKIGYERTQDLFEGVVESLVAGAGSGGLVSTAVGISNKLSRAEKALKEQGYSDKDIEVMEDAVGGEMVAHKDTIEPMFQENIKKSINNLNALKEKFAGLPEQTRLQISRELEGVYGTVRENLKGVVDDVEADSIAKLQQGRALYMYEATGMMPSEYIKKMPEIRRAENIDKAKFNTKQVKKASLLPFIRSKGGVIDENGDLKNMDAQKQFIGLVNKNGLDLDTIGEIAWEEGYFSERPTVAELLEAIDNELRGNKLYPLGYVEQKGISQAENEEVLNNAISQVVSEKGLDISKLSYNEKVSIYDDIVAKQEYNRLSEEDQERVAMMEDGGMTTRKAIDELMREKNLSVSDDMFFQESLDIAKQNDELDAKYPAYEGETITINGQEKTVYNSNGDRIAKSKEALENFYRWFGDSKVVDEQGRPLVVYHGTSEEFNTFDKSKIGKNYSKLGGGFYFTNQQREAKGYGKTFNVYILLKNPINITNNSKNITKEQRQRLIDYLKNDVKHLRDNMTSDDEMFLHDLYFDINYNVRNEKFSEAIKNVLGADGIVNRVVTSKYDNNLFEYVVFNPNQIKSTSNRGTYSESENIYYQSAWHGGRELEGGKFSLKYAGKQVGLAHGYGVYASAEVAPATGYRSMVDENITYKGKNIAEVEKELRKAKENDKANLVLDFAYKQNREELDKEDYSPETWTWFENEFLPNVESKGKLYEVDVPEDAQLIEENKKFTELPMYIQQNIRKVFNELSDQQINKVVEDNSWLNKDKQGHILIKKEDLIQNMLEGEVNSGGAVYGYLSDALGSAKAASEMLTQNGVKGIAYYDNTDGRCFVIFNPDDVKVIQKFYQNESSPLGAYSNNIIYLFQKANRSTLAHELAHSWHNELLSMQEYDKIKQDLETFNRWYENEFNRKYKVEKRANGYAVVNKQGNVVYDKSGNGFMSEQDAKDYAKEELFARGFEEYLREGKAPSNALKQAFRNFLMWLKKIYKDAMALNIELSPDMKNFYADILGGADLDFFLNSTPETFIENRVKLGKERESELDNIISEAQSKKSTKSKPINKRLKDIWTVSAIPLSTRAKRVTIKLRTRIRRYEFGLLTNLRDRYNKAKPFFDIWKKMSENDAIAFDLALKNDYVPKQLEIVDKYNARKEWESVRELLTSIYDDAINAGLDLNYRPDYFPRKVKDVDGFLSYLRNSPNWTRFEEALRDADPENIFTVEEKADFLNKYLRGYVKVDMLPNKYSSEKERKIDIIDNVMNQYYSDSIESLIMYIEGMNKRIEAAKFLGKDSENYDESIGGYLTYLLNNNIINPKQVDEVRDILRARLGERGVSNEGLKTLRDISYMYTMGGINSAITQIDDLSTSMYKAGVWNTLSSALSAKRITRKDLGLDVISDEFRDSSSTAKALNKLFKITGLDGIDSFAKETLVNAMLKKYRQYSDETLREVIEPIMEDDTAQTIEDIRNNNITDNVLFLLFNDLSDVQPISKSELPAFYNTSGNLRILYMLKSFMIKRIDIFRNECFDKIKDPKTRKEGVQNLVRLTVFMMLMGASKDMLIDLLYGRDVEMSETMVNNALGLAGISKFQVYQAKEKGFTGVIKDFSVPPIFAIYDDLINDISKVSEGKRDLKNLEVLKGIPLVGRFYYWWVGRGKEKLEKRNKKTY